MSMTKLFLWTMLGMLVSMRMSHGLRILGVFPLNGKSHFVICERLMRGLAERGHQVDVYSHFPLEKPPANYTDYSLRGSMPIMNFTYDTLSKLPDIISIIDMLRIIGQPICELMNHPVFQQLIHEPPSDPPYDIVIIEMFMSNCYLALGRHLKIPIIAVVSTTLFDWLNDPLGNPINEAVESSVFSRSVGSSTFLDRVYNVMFSTYVKWTFNYFAHEQDAIVRNLFGSNFPDVIELQKDISLTLVNYHNALNGIRSFTPAVIPVGGLQIFDNDDVLQQDVQTFLDESKDGFIYFSFGSMVRIETFPKHVLEAFYRSFQKIAPVRVLMKVTKANELPSGIPPNVFVKPWLPQIKVLRHKNIKIFITHGGLMGTQESIYFGVPMVGIPLFADQYFNIESYVNRNMAVKLDKNNLTESAITYALMKLLTDSSFKTSVNKASQAFKDMPMKPMDTSAFWIEYIARHGKDALRSPLVDMDWWKISSIDIYCFFFVVIFLALYLTIGLFRVLFRDCLCKRIQIKSKLKVR